MKKRYWMPIIISAAVVIVAAFGVLGYRFSRSSPGNPFSKLEFIGGTRQTAYRWPAEFERQQAIWLQWPSEVYNSGDRPVNSAMIKIITSLAPHVRVNVASRNNSEIAQIKSLLKNSGYTGTNVHFYNVNHYSIWARDVGPIFVRNGRGGFNVVDFGFNNYSRDGSQTYVGTEGQVDRSIAKILGLPVIKANLVSEGGAIESNGKGVMMLTESVVLKRNPGMTRQQIENEYKRVLGVTKVIWLKKGLAEDDNITSGHINEIARFANSSTILLARILPADRYVNNYSKESYLRLEENYNILKNAADQDGKPFKIIRVPMPPTLYNVTDKAGRLPVRSYINYAVTNGAVLMQTYWKPGRSQGLKETEDGVKEIFKGVFPGRTVIGLDTENINLWGGGIHCVTQHMPAQ